MRTTGLVAGEAFFSAAGKAVTAVAVPRQTPTAVVGNLGGWQYDATNGAVWPNNPEFYK